MKKRRKRKKATAVSARATIHRTLLNELAELADSQGIWATDLPKHPDLLEEAGIVPSEATAVHCSAADRLNRERTNDLLDKYDTGRKAAALAAHSRPPASKKRVAKRKRRSTMATSDAVTVSIEDAVKLFEELGFSQAGQWSARRIKKKMEKLPELKEDDVLPESRGMKKLFKTLIAAVESDSDIELDAAGAVDDDDPDEKPARKTAKGKRATKKAAAKKEPTLKELGAAADKNDDEEAMEAITAACEAVDIDPDEYDTWAKAAAAVERKSKNGKTAGKKTAKKTTRSRSGEPSNKLVIYRAWKKKRGKMEPADAVKLVKNAVKESTVRNWFSSWGRDQGLPAGA